MSKITLSKGTVVEENGTRTDVQVTENPRKTEAGWYWTPKFNTKGIATIQAKQGQQLSITIPVITDSKGLENFLAEIFGVSPDGLGQLAKWKETEDKAKTQVLVNEQPFMGVVPAPVEPIQPTAVANVGIDRDETNIIKVMEALKKNAKPSDLIQALTTKYGDTNKATDIYNIAVKRYNTPIVAPTPEPTAFDFK